MATESYPLKNKQSMLPALERYQASHPISTALYTK